jgi:hypothetical protein
MLGVRRESVMSGWRDVEGRTNAERRRANADTERKSFLDRLRNRPTSLVKPLLGFCFVVVLVFALMLAIR